MSEGSSTSVVPDEARRDMSGGRFPLRERGKFAEAHPDRADAWTFFAQGDIDSGAYEEALEHANEAIRLDPLQARAWSWKSMALALLGDKDGAESAIASVPAEIREAPDIIAARAGLLTLDGNFEQAAALLTLARDLDPDRIGHWTDLAYTQLMVDSALADKTVEDTLARFPEHVDAYTLAGRGRLKRRDLAGGEEYARFAVASGPESASAWALLAQAQVYQGKLDEAKRAAQHALDINPRRAEAWSILAKIATERGEGAEAMRCREEAEKSQRLFRFGPIIQKAIQALASNRAREAKRCAKQVLESQEARLYHTAARNLLLQIAQNEKNRTETARLLSEIERAGTKGPEWYEHASRLQFEQNRPEEAFSIASEGVGLFPGNGNLHAHKLLAASKIDDPEVGSYVEAAMAVGYQGPQDGAMIAMALDSIGRKEDRARFVAHMKAKYPEDQTIELIDATQGLETNPFEAMRRVKRLTRPEFSGLARKGTLLSCLLLLPFVAMLVLMLPFVILKKGLRSLLGRRR